MNGMIAGESVAPTLFDDATPLIASPSSPLKLRGYQEECVESIESGLDRGLTRMLYVSATGTGKTVIAGKVIDNALVRRRAPALFVTHRDELVNQALEDIRLVVGPKLRIGIEKGLSRADSSCDIVIASLPSISRSGSSRLHWITDSGCSVLVYDEAHHSRSDGSVRVMERFGVFDDRKTTLIGATATPHRLDGKALEGDTAGAIFQECVYKYDLYSAIVDKNLSDVRSFVIRSETDLSGVKVIAGDYSEADLSRRINNAARTDLAIKHWKELASDRCTMAFCCDVEHAEDVAAAYRAAGISAAAVSGDMQAGDRDDAFKRFRSGDIQVLTNCNLCTEGFNHRPLSCVVMLRPTKSWTLYNQQIGRGTRLSPETGKVDCIVLDVVDLCDELNLMTAPKAIGLPAGVDLQGKSLAAAKAEMDGLGDRVKHLPSKPGKWSDMFSYAKEINLFAIPQIPEELKIAGATLRWFKTLKGYRVSCGPGQTVNLYETPLGWEGEFTIPGRVGVVKFHDAPSLEAVVVRAERTAKKFLPDTNRMAVSGSSWDNKPPTQMQIKRLRSLARTAKVAGFDASKIKTKGDASTLIAQLLIDPKVIAADTKRERNRSRYAPSAESYSEALA